MRLEQNQLLLDSLRNSAYIFKLMTVLIHFSSRINGMECYFALFSDNDQMPSITNYFQIRSILVPMIGIIHLCIILCCFFFPLVNVFYLNPFSLAIQTDTCANNVDPDETAYNESSHQDLHSLPFFYYYFRL